MARFFRLSSFIAVAAYAALICSPKAFAQSAAAGGGNSTATTPGASGMAAGANTATAATSGGSSAASASSAAAAAAAANGGSSSSAFPSFAATPAAALVQPKLVPVAVTAYTGLVVEEVVKFSKQSCTPAAFTPPKAKPANYTGPGMSITFTTGTCTIPATGSSATDAGGAAAAATVAAGSRRLLNSTVTAAVASPSSDGTAGGSIIKCTEPSLTIIKTPALYTSAYTTAPLWTGKECKIEQTVGTPTKEVLFTFNDNEVIDPLALASLIQSKLSAILTEGYQDLVKQIASSVTLTSAGSAVSGLVGSAAQAAPAAAAAAAAGPAASVGASVGR